MLSLRRSPKVRAAAELELRRREAERDITDGPIALEVEKCRADIEHFIDSHLVIDDSQGDSVGGEVPFLLWAAQLGRVVLLFSQGETESDEMLRRL
jgi:hypothetical protein